MSLKKQKSTIFLGTDFSKKISFCYISSLYQGFVFFPLWILWYNHIGDHPQEGLISVMSNRNWYMGIFLEFFVWSPMDHSKDNFINNYLIFKLKFFFYFLIMTSFLKNLTTIFPNKYFHFISISLVLSPCPPT